MALHTYQLIVANFAFPSCYRTERGERRLRWVRRRSRQISTSDGCSGAGGGGDLVNRHPGPFYSLVPRVRSRARFSTTSPWRRLLLFLCLLSGEFVFSDGQAGGEVLRMQQLASEVSSLRTFVLTFFFSGGCGHGGLFSGVQQVSLPVLHISFGICVGVGAGVCEVPLLHPCDGIGASSLLRLWELDSSHRVLCRRWQTVGCCWSLLDSLAGLH